MFQHDYVTLPVKSKVNGVLIRWYQPVTLVTTALTNWNIDNVHIGGSAINDFEIFERFDNSSDKNGIESQVEMLIMSNICDNIGHSLVGNWNMSSYSSGSMSSQSVTTKQLIVQKLFMIQFKVFFPHDSFACSTVC